MAAARFNSFGNSELSYADLTPLPDPEQAVRRIIAKFQARTDQLADACIILLQLSSPWFFPPLLFLFRASAFGQSIGMLPVSCSI